jgi:hypothetical protein
MNYHLTNNILLKDQIRVKQILIALSKLWLRNSNNKSNSDDQITQTTSAAGFNTNRQIQFYVVVKLIIVSYSQIQTNEAQPRQRE